MELSKRRTHSPEFKARVAMVAISGRKTNHEIAAEHAMNRLKAAHLRKLWATGAWVSSEAGKMSLVLEWLCGHLVMALKAFFCIIWMVLEADSRCSGTPLPCSGCRE